jgi:hypothetical protein
MTGKVVTRGIYKQKLVPFSKHQSLETLGDARARHLGVGSLHPRFMEDTFSQASYDGEYMCGEMKLIWRIAAS